jgi:hypothetical protein
VNEATTRDASKVPIHAKSTLPKLNNFPAVVQWSYSFIEKFAPEDVARELTMRSFEILANVTVGDVRHTTPLFPLLLVLTTIICPRPQWVSFATSPQSQRPRSLVALIDEFNNVIHWVQGSIVSVTKLKKRVARMKFFIEVAHAMSRHQDMNGVVAIMAGLSTLCVHRLKNTKSVLKICLVCGVSQPFVLILLRCLQGLSSKSSAKFAELQCLVSPDASFRDLRTKQAEMSHSPPFLPYPGLYLTDLVFIEGAQRSNFN